MSWGGPKRGKKKKRNSHILVTGIQEMSCQTFDLRQMLSHCYQDIFFSEEAQELFSVKLTLESY